MSELMRGITEDEKALLTQVCMFGSDGYPIHKYGPAKWTWGPWRSINGVPTVFKTKRAAVASFEAFLDVLLDANAGRI